MQGSCPTAVPSMCVCVCVCLGREGTDINPISSQTNVIRLLVFTKTKFMGLTGSLGVAGALRDQFPGKRFGPNTSGTQWDMGWMHGAIVGELNCGAEHSRAGGCWRHCSGGDAAEQIRLRVTGRGTVPAERR